MSEPRLRCTRVCLGSSKAPLWKTRCEVFGLMAKTAAADAAVYRQQMIEDLWYVAGDVGLVTMLGTTSVQATLARAFDGVAA